MIDERLVARKLATLGTASFVFRDGGRVISNGLVPPPAAAILEEIDNTILKRRVTFRAGAERLTFVVAGRRLLALAAASEGLAGAAELVGEVLSHDDPGQMEAVGSLIALIAQDERPVLVEAVPTDEGGNRGNVGIPVERLAELMQIDLAEPVLPMQMFLEACEGLYTACLFRAGEAWIGHAEEAELLERLRDVAERQWERFREAYGRHVPAADTPRLVMLEGAAGGEDCLSAAWGYGEFALLVHGRDDLLDIHHHWRRIFTL
ncbi:MAG: hypothetical protein Kow0045_12210 [Albidovulum sp.]